MGLMSLTSPEFPCRSKISISVHPDPPRCSFPLCAEFESALPVECEKMNDMKNSDRRWILVLLACLAVSLVSVAYPMYVIQPFRAQGVRELMVALTVSRFGPVLTLISALAALAAAIAYWRGQAPKRGRMLVAAGAVVVCVLAVLARANVYEQLLFHPVEHPEFGAAADVKLDNDDKVMVIKIGGSARAYPIRDNGLPPCRQRRGRRDGAGCDVLNALSHRSGVDERCGWPAADVSSGRHQQSELPHARRGDRELLAADQRRRHFWSTEGPATHFGTLR